MDRVKGKVAFVTGAASGIGEAAAHILAAEGAKVAVADIDDKNGQRVVEAIKAAKGTAQFWHMNVTDEKEVDKTLADVFKTFRKLHIVVNSAGIPGYQKPTHEITTAEWDRVMDINLKGTFFVNRAAIPFLLKTKEPASVVNISSMLGLIGGGDPVYHASKGGVRLMTKSDATVYAGQGIRFNSVHPGYILTPLFQGFGKADPRGAKAFYDEMAAKIPIPRLGTADDVGRGILFLASDESSYITGTELVIDGGYSII
jgi:NAD(P)-dependent dehydrogenase (short-subunit alcohol dehydrogenase family)